jgi:hypothetical protein
LAEGRQGLLSATPWVSSTEGQAEVLAKGGKEPGGIAHLQFLRILPELWELGRVSI